MRMNATRYGIAAVAVLVVLAALWTLRPASEPEPPAPTPCPLYTSDAADDRRC